MSDYIKPVSVVNEQDVLLSLPKSFHLNNLKQQLTRMLLSDSIVQLYGGSMETFKMSTYIWCTQKFRLQQLRKQINQVLKQYLLKRFQVPEDASSDCIETCMSKFEPRSVCLWFDNQCKGRRHPAGAHFLCAKKYFPPGTVVMTERSIVSTVYAPQGLHVCASCFKNIDSNRFVSCGEFNQVVYCNLECKKKNWAPSFESGLYGFLRAHLSPTSFLLWQLYSKTNCSPDYTKRRDLSQRSTLSTDADLHSSSNRVFDSKLPKRSYQYRYLLLTNEQSPKESITNSSNRMIGPEVVLALRETIDHKEESLSKLSKQQVADIVFEALLLSSALQILAKNNPASHDEEKKDKQKLCFLAIVQDLIRFNRMHVLQTLEENMKDETVQYCHLPFIGNVFWRACKPNLEVTFNRATGLLEYRTTTNVKKYDKLTLPTRSNEKDCQCFDCSSQNKVVAHREVKPIEIVSFKDLLKF